MISCVIKLYLGVFIAQECQQHMMVCPKHGDAYVIRWRTGKTKCCVSTEVAGHETKSNKTEEIPGWTTVIFQKPACLFQLDRIYFIFISFSGNLRFRSSSQSRQILKCILRD